MCFNGLIWKNKCFLHLYIYIYMWSKNVHFLWSCAVTYSLERSLWDANWFSGSQETPGILWNLKVHYHTYKCPTPAPILSHISPVHSPLILISHLHLGFPSYLFPSGFPTKTLYATLLSPTCATCPGHLILLDLITRIIFREQYRSFSSSLCSFLHCPLTSSLLGPNILLSTLLSNTLSLCTSLNVNKQVSHPY